MPNPTASDVHVNVPLTNISIAWIQQQNAFVATQVFPNIPVQQQSNRYYTYQRDDFYRTEATVRAPGTESAGSGWRIDNTPTYYCDVIAVHKDVDDQIRANSDSVISLDRDSTLWLSQQLLIKRDNDWAANYFATTKWTGASNGSDLTGVTGTPTSGQFKQWDQAGSSPIEDIRAQRVFIAGKTGYRPNTLVISAKVWSILQDHPEFLDRIKYTQRGMVSTDLLAAVLELDQVVVAWGVKSSNAEGQTESTDFIFGKNALLCYSAPAPSLMTPSAGYTFSWVGYVGAGPMGNRVSTFRMDHLKSDRVEGEMSYAMKIIAPELGAFFSGAVA